MILRRMDKSDAQNVRGVFYDAVHGVEEKYYTVSQKNAWAPMEYDEEKYIERVSAGYALVAVETDAKGAETITGYGNIDDNGYIDHLYVKSAFQGCGVGKAICDRLEKYAENSGACRLSVHASLSAKKFFMSRGYACVEKMEEMRNGVTLVNFLMEKVIG